MCPTCSRSYVSHVPPPSCLICLVPYVSFSLCVLVSHVPRALRALMPYEPRALPALLPHMLRVLRALLSPMLCAASHASYPVCFRGPCTFCHKCSRASHALCPMCLRGLWALSPYVPLVHRTLRTLCVNITFRALGFQCLALLFLCSLPTRDFLEIIY